MTGGAQRVDPLPTDAAVIAETVEVTAEEQTLLKVARLAQGVLEIRVNLDLKNHTERDYQVSSLKFQ